MFVVCSIHCGAVRASQTFKSMLLPSLYLIIFLNSGCRIFAPFSWLTSPFHFLKSPFLAHSTWTLSTNVNFQRILCSFIFFRHRILLQLNVHLIILFEDTFQTKRMSGVNLKMVQDRTSKTFFNKTTRPDEPLCIFHRWHRVDQTSLKRHGQVPRWHCWSNYSALTTSSLPDLAVYQQSYSHWRKSCARRDIVQWRMEELLARLTKCERE